MSTIKTDLVDSVEKVTQASILAGGRDGSGNSGGTLAKLSIPAEAIRTLPAEFVKRHQVLPLEIEGGTLHIATAKPGNERVIDDIRLLSGLEVRESVMPVADILEKMAECYQVTVEKMIENLNPEGSATMKARICTTSR